MYNSAGPAVGGAVAGGGALAATGANVLWLLLAAFTLVSAGVALMRVAPSRHTGKRK